MAVAALSRPAPRPFPAWSLWHVHDMAEREGVDPETWGKWYDGYQTAYKEFKEWYEKGGAAKEIAMLLRCPSCGNIGCHPIVTKGVVFQCDNCPAQFDEGGAA